MNFTILSCGHDPESRSRILAREAERLLSEQGYRPTFVDLRDLALPTFDNATAFDHPAFEDLHRAIESADGVFLAAPIYNWGLGSGAKNLIELTGATGEGGRTSAWFDKVVTFLCSGGLPHSYMAYGAVAMSLMLDFKCVVNPYVVYATGRDWGPDLALSEQLQDRLEKTVAVKVQLAAALQSRTYRSDWEV